MSVRPEEFDPEQLVERIADALAARGAADGSRLLDLMRTEQNLIDALSTIRREIRLVVQRSQPLPDA